MRHCVSHKTIESCKKFGDRELILKSNRTNLTDFYMQFFVRQLWGTKSDWTSRFCMQNFSKIGQLLFLINFVCPNFLLLIIILQQSVSCGSLSDYSAQCDSFVFVFLSKHFSELNLFTVLDIFDWLEVLQFPDMPDKTLHIQVLKFLKKYYFSVATLRKPCCVSCFVRMKLRLCANQAAILRDRCCDFARLIFDIAWLILWLCATHVANLRDPFLAMLCLCSTHVASFTRLNARAEVWDFCRGEFISATNSITM